MLGYWRLAPRSWISRFFESAAFFPVHMGFVHAAETAQGGLGWAGFEQEMVAGDPLVIGKRAILHSPEQEGVVLGDFEGL